MITLKKFLKITFLIILIGSITTSILVTMIKRNYLKVDNLSYNYQIN